MKPFTYAQKKWALTATLVAVLGFNVSMHNYHQEFGSFNLASTAADPNLDDVLNGKESFAVVTNKGTRMASVIHQKGSDNVYAVVSATNTEGEICTANQECKPDVIELPENTMKSLNDIRAAVLKELSVQKVADSSSSDDDKKSSDSKAVSTDSVQYTKDKLAELKARCQKDGISDDNDDAIQCYSDGIETIIKNARTKDKVAIDQTQLSSFMKTTVYPVAQKRMDNISSRVMALYSTNYQDPKASIDDALAAHLSDSSSIYDAIKKADKDLNALRIDSISTMNNLLQDKTPEFQAIKKDIVGMQVEFLRHIQSEIETEKAKAKDYRDPVGAQAALNKYVLEYGDIRQVNNDIILSRQDLPEDSFSQLLEKQYQAVSQQILNSTALAAQAQTTAAVPGTTQQPGQRTATDRVAGRALPTNMRGAAAGAKNGFPAIVSAPPGTVITQQVPVTAQLAAPATSTATAAPTTQAVPVAPATAPVQNQQFQYQPQQFQYQQLQQVVPSTTNVRGS
jgi:hypothetical protein